MRHAAALTLVLLLVPLITGCGTFANLSGKSDFHSVWPAADPTPEFYGGVRNDIMWMQESGEEPSFFALDKWIFGVDALASSVADTITLPVVALKRHERKSADGRD